MKAAIRRAFDGANRGMCHHTPTAHRTATERLCSASVIQFGFLTCLLSRSILKLLVCSSLFPFSSLILICCSPSWAVDAGMHTIRYNAPRLCAFPDLISCVFPASFQNLVGNKPKGEVDQEFEEHECNCMPIGGDPNAPTCYDDQCHNYATMQECRKDRCHPGCRNQRIQVCATERISQLD